MCAGTPPLGSLRRGAPRACGERCSAQEGRGRTGRGRVAPKGQRTVGAVGGSERFWENSLITLLKTLPTTGTRDFSLSSAKVRVSEQLGPLP